MRSFDEIFAIAAERKGGRDQLEALLEPPSGETDLAAIPDDRWLSCATKCIFNAGFNWKVVEAMWPGFEEVFHGFDIGWCSMLNDEEIAGLASDTRIVRHGGKIRAVQENAVFLRDLAAEHGSAARFFADWPVSDQAGLLELLKKRGSRLGGNTGQYFLRFMGKDSYVLSRDVIARLVAEGVVDKAPTSRGAMAKVQAAFNTWQEQSGRSVKEISRTLAMSVG
ncbi:DNA-3-methyladenine glycosylase I [Oricola sp.]|uniref:DNA-3-methyladenine glycosylase I n=1 Tax=Oricola sp. TaxID=1979950 RepID=UPI0025D03799|nr:DNA-3-methyladenine glycosylase I [Oricola sp.]MCI5073936.1 DNA-3-methyladenine glycosylase I [Oricola sp.]